MSNLYNQDDRSLLSMYVDLMVAMPSEWQQFKSQTFATEPDGGILTNSLNSLIKEFSQINWSQQSSKEHLEQFLKISDKLESGNISERVAAQSLNWAVNIRKWVEK